MSQILASPVSGWLNISASGASFSGARDLSALVAVEFLPAGGQQVYFNHQHNHPFAFVGYAGTGASSRQISYSPIFPVRFVIGCRADGVCLIWTPASPALSFVDGIMSISDDRWNQSGQDYSLVLFS